MNPLSYTEKLSRFLARDRPTLLGDVNEDVVNLLNKVRKAFSTTILDLYRKGTCVVIPGFGSFTFYREPVESTHDACRIRPVFCLLETYEHEHDTLTHFESFDHSRAHPSARLQHLSRWEVRPTTVPLNMRQVARNAGVPLDVATRCVQGHIDYFTHCVRRRTKTSIDLGFCTIHLDCQGGNQRHVRTEFTADFVTEVDELERAGTLSGRRNLHTTATLIPQAPIPLSQGWREAYPTTRDIDRIHLQTARDPRFLAAETHRVTLTRSGGARGAEARTVTLQDVQQLPYGADLDEQFPGRVPVGTGGYDGYSDSNHSTQGSAYRYGRGGQMTRREGENREGRHRDGSWSSRDSSRRSSLRQGYGDGGGGEGRRQQIEPVYGRAATPRSDISGDWGMGGFQPVPSHTPSASVLSNVGSADYYYYE